MFEAYSVAVRVSLINGVTGGLMAISRQFNRTGADAKALQRELNGIKLLMGAGAITAGAGFFGLNLFAKTITPAKEYTHQLTQMNIAGMKQAEIAKAIQASWALGSKIPTQTAAQNLEMIKELRSVVGNTTEAINVLPTVAKLQAVLSNVKGVKDSKGTAFEVAKLLDLRGASMDPAQFEAQAQMMTKAIVASGGTIGVKDFFSTGKYGRTATAGWNNEFLYEIVPTLIQELKTGSGGGGAGGPGNALMSAYAAVVAGQIGKKQLTLFNQLGLVDPSKAVWTKSGEVRGVLPGGIKGSDMFQANPFEWTQKVLMPALQKAGITDPKRQQEYLAQMFTNRTAGFVFSQMALQPTKFTRDQGLVKGAMGLEAYQTLLKTNPFMAEQALAAQWKDTMTIIGLEILPALISGFRKLATGIREVNMWMRENPKLTKAIVWGLVALAGALAFGGTLAMVAGGVRLLGVGVRLLGLAKPAAAAAGVRGLAAAMPLFGGAVVGMAGAIAAAAGIIAGISFAGFAFHQGFTKADRYKKIKAMAARGTPLTHEEAAFAVDYAQTNLKVVNRENSSQKNVLRQRWTEDLALLGARPGGGVASQFQGMAGTTPFASRGGGAAPAVKGNVYLDKKKVGEVLDDHFAQGASARYLGAPRADPGQSLAGGFSSGAR